MKKSLNGDKIKAVGISSNNADNKEPFRFRNSAANKEIFRFRDGAANKEPFRFRNGAANKEIFRLSNNAANRGTLTAGEETGSVTMESILIVPIVFLTVCLILYSIILLFERGALLNSVVGAVIEASESWKETDDLSVNLRESDLYWRMADVSRGEKLSITAANAVKEFFSSSVDGFTSAEAYSDSAKNPISRYVEAGMKNATEFPEKKVMRQFRLPNIFTADIKARSIIPDFAEFIRNADFVMDIENELTSHSFESGSYVESFNEILESIHSYIRSLE